MSLGARIKEERNRLGLNQTDFGALAGASRRAIVNWEADGAAPLATALMAWAEAGADALYMLTGRRTTDRPNNAATQIEDQLSGIRRNIADPSRDRSSGESLEETEKRVLRASANALQAILNYDKSFLTPDVLEEVEHLFDIATNSAALALYRAADYAQMHRKRREMKAGLSEYLVGGAYVPGEAVTNILTAMALEYAVPQKLIAELYHEISEDIASR